MNLSYNNHKVFYKSDVSCSSSDFDAHYGNADIVCISVLFAIMLEKLYCICGLLICRYRSKHRKCRTGSREAEEST